MSHLVAETSIPHESPLIACHREVIAEETVVGLILRVDVGTHLSLANCRL